MDKELLIKYFDNSCTEEELNSVLTWFKESAGTTEGKALLFKTWEEIPNKAENLKTNFNQILDRIHHKVNLKQAENLIETSASNPVRYKNRGRFIEILTKAAAIILFPALAFGMVMYSKYDSIKHGQIAVNQSYNEVFSSRDAITKITLPDGSNVFLNHSSTLKYPSMFLGESRTVELKGEGYFEVTHNLKIPFIVKVGEIQIIARGTKFNLLAYPEENKIETSLINGIVEIQKTEFGARDIPLLILKPNQLAVYKKGTKEIITSKIIDERNFSWIDGKLVFNKAPMDEVIRKLSRWFNVDINVKDPELLDLTITATFVNETLPQVMELLTLVTPISYSISNREVLSPGIFSKRTVVLSNNNK